MGKKGNFLKINDLVNFTLTSKELINIKDDFQAGRINPTQTKTGMVIKIAATHAGIITRNNGFYLPDRMKKGASTFTEHFGKPILCHHNDDGDPIGRVIDSQYIDTAGAVRDQYRGLEIKDSNNKIVGSINDSLIDDFNTGKMPFGMQVDVIRNAFSRTILDDANYGGLGFISITANIVDPAAIEKFLDGRYLTGSVGATTDSAVCSVCKQDWTDSGQCEHKPGAVYDKAKCFIIAGELNYDEYSVVNKPADRHSRVLELSYNGIRNSVDTADEYNGRLYDVVLEFPRSNKEEDKMADNAQTEIKDSVQEGQVTQAPVVEQTQEQPKVEDKVEFSLDEFLTKVLSLQDNIADEDEEKLYSLMLDEMKADGLTEKEIEDAKLSTEKRKKLAGSTFCGPGRSFPVPDCAHVTAARRLIGRYKGEGSKESILACVSRKAKALGCGGDSKKEDKAEVVAPAEQVKDCALTNVLHSLLGILEMDQHAEKYDDTKALDEADLTLLKGLMEKLVGKFGPDAVEDSLKEQELMKSLIKRQQDIALLDEIIKLENVIGDLRDQQKEIEEQNIALKDEFKALSKDVEILQDSLVSEKVKERKVKENYYGLLLDLKTAKVEDRTETFKAINDQVLDIEIEKVMKDIDTKKITDKLNDGITRTPTETVDNPTGIYDSKKEEETQKSDEDYLVNTWLKLDKIYGRKTADAFKNKFLAGKISDSKK